MSASENTILVVEDHEPLWDVIRRAAAGQPWSFRFAPSGEKALAALEARIDDVDAALVDLRLPGMSGIEVLQRLCRLDPWLPCIMFTGVGDPDSVVQCMKAGAYDYVTKPFRNADLVLRLLRALEKRSLARRCAHFESEDYLSSLMGPSEAVRRLSRLVSQVSPVDLAVLIEGESGTGKELVARRIHALSRRNAGPFVPVDCGAIPETLLEGELFGFRKGSFTGAHTDREGKVQAAHGGTLFLDEIGNFPLLMQAKLLRVLQEKVITPIGSTRAVPVDVRVVSASNAPLRRKVDRGEFRLDLFHRIAEFPIAIPPVRQRPDDAIFLCALLLREAASELGKACDGYTEEALQYVMEGEWPGNVRELRNAIRRAVVLSDGRIQRRDLEVASPPAPARHVSRWKVGESHVLRVEAVIAEAAIRAGRVPFKEVLQGLHGQIEREIIECVLEGFGGNVSRAARALRLDYKTVHTKVKGYGIPRRKRHGQEVGTG